MEGNTIENIDPRFFNRIHFWGKAAGLITILYGLVKIFQSLHIIVGPLPGIFSIILGICMYKSGVGAKDFVKANRQDAQPLNLLFKYYSLFLTISGWLIIVMIMMLLVFFIFIAN